MAKRKRVKHREITATQAEEVSASWRFAIEQGVPLNVFVSINWAHAPAPEPRHPIERNALLRDSAKAFLRRHAPGVLFAWIEVREKPRTKGEGVHLVFHVPDRLRERFASAIHRWVGNQSAEVGPHAVDVREVGVRWWDRRDYMLKAGSEEVASAYRTARFKKPNQGVVEGPRVRIAHSLGPTARYRAGAAPEVLNDLEAAEAHRVEVMGFRAPKPAASKVDQVR